jgi:hypothetical protein
MLKILIGLFASVPLLFAQQAPRVLTIQDLFTRNVGNTEQQNKQFPPHKIAGNVYYVGTESLCQTYFGMPVTGYSSCRHAGLEGMPVG